MNEDQRLHALERLEILYTPPEEVFDQIAALAAHHFVAPFATIGFIAENVLWLKSAHGLDVTELKRDLAFCEHTIQTSDRVMVVTDATQDPRFRDNPLVTGPPHFRFYAGAPLITRSGARVGTISVLDDRPRSQISDGDCAFLTNLAAVTVAALGMRLATKEIRHELEEKSKIEAQLNLLNKRFTLAITNSPVVLCTEDRNLRYTWIANPPPPLSESDFIGKTVDEVIGSVAAAPLADLKRRARDEGRLVRGSVRLDLGAGERRFDVTYEPLFEAGEIVGVSGAAIDVTERQRAEEDLTRALQRSKAAEAAKTRFLAAASHDLRQPVQSLFLMLDVLQKRLAGNPAASVAASSLEVLRGLRGLLDDLLDISKLEAGLVVPRLGSVDLGGLLTRLAQPYRPLVKEKGLKLRLRCQEITVSSDPVLLERILQNLITNAVRYTEHGGILLACRTRHGQARIDVIDTGSGIPADRIPDIFEEFVQLSNPGRNRQKGMGLGLAIVRRLAALLGHQIVVRSRPGHGTTFSVELAVAAKPETECRPSAPPVDLHGRILVIDDETQVADSLAMALEASGLDVHVAAGPAEALSELHGHRPDAVLADFRLGEGMTGLDAIATVRNHFGGVIPAALLTGDTSPERLRQAESSGCPLLHKPVSLDQLLVVMKEMLDGRGQTHVQ